MSAIFFLTKDKLDQKDFEGAKYVCSPPPRTKEDQLEVWKGIQNGTFDVFSSDHCPFFYEGKKEKMLKEKMHHLVKYQMDVQV